MPLSFLYVKLAVAVCVPLNSPQKLALTAECPW